MARIVHIAGAQVQVGKQARQRCAWCGAVMIDVALDRIAVPEGQSGGPAMWEPGALVAVDGGVSFVIPHLDGEDVPDDSCAALDPGSDRMTVPEQMIVALCAYEAAAITTRRVPTVSQLCRQRRSVEVALLAVLLAHLHAQVKETIAEASPAVTG